MFGFSFIENHFFFLVCKMRVNWTSGLLAISIFICVSFIMHFAQVIFKMRIIRLLDNKKEEKGKGEEEEEEVEEKKKDDRTILGSWQQ